MKIQQTTTIKTSTNNNLLPIYNPVCNGTIQSIFYGTTLTWLFKIIQQEQKSNIINKDQIMSFTHFLTMTISGNLTC